MVKRIEKSQFRYKKGVSERALCEGVPKIGSFLSRVLKKCFGVGLVDEDITALVRCVLISDDVCEIVLFNMLCCL